MKLINAGCGPIKLPGWINVDISTQHSPDVLGNVLELEFEDVDAIWSSHSLEHYAYPYGVVKALSNFYKWLKPGGILRIGVPDVDQAVRLYMAGRAQDLYGKEFKGFYYKDTQAERLTFFFREWEHTIMFDKELLTALLVDAGFSKIWVCQPNNSLIPDFNHDRFIPESLFMEAQKA